MALKKSVGFTLLPVKKSGQWMVALVSVEMSPLHGEGSLLFETSLFVSDLPMGKK
jgi:hypothetical protein